MAPKVCECCGQALPEAFEAIGKRSGLSRGELAVFLKVARAEAQLATWTALLDRLYGDDAEGGALWAVHTIRGLVRRANKKIAPFGYRMINVRGQGYRLAEVAA